MNNDLTVEQQQDAVKNKKVYDNSIVLSNILELTSSVIFKLADTDTSESLAKSDLNKAVINNLISNRIKEKLLA